MQADEAKRFGRHNPYCVDLGLVCLGVGLGVCFEIEMAFYTLSARFCFGCK